MTVVGVALPRLERHDLDRQPVALRERLDLPLPQRLLVRVDGLHPAARRLEAEALDVLDVLVDHRVEPVRLSGPVRGAEPLDLGQADALVSRAGDVLVLHEVEQVQHRPVVLEPDPDRHVLPAGADDHVGVGEVDVAAADDLAKRHVPRALHPRQGQRPRRRRERGDGDVLGAGRDVERPVDGVVLPLRHGGVGLQDVDRGPLEQLPPVLDALRHVGLDDVPDERGEGQRPGHGLALVQRRELVQHDGQAYLVVLRVRHAEHERRPAVAAVHEEPLDEDGAEGHARLDVEVAEVLDEGLDVAVDLVLRDRRLDVLEDDAEARAVVLHEDGPEHLVERDELLAALKEAGPVDVALEVHGLVACREAWDVDGPLNGDLLQRSGRERVDNLPRRVGQQGPQRLGRGGTKVLQELKGRQSLRGVLRALLRRLRVLQDAGHVVQRPLGEDLVDGECETGQPGLGNELHGTDGVAAETEEAVVETDIALGEPEDAAPEGPQAALLDGRGRDAFRGGFAGRVGLLSEIALLAGDLNGSIRIELGQAVRLVELAGLLLARRRPRRLLKSGKRQLRLADNHELADDSQRREASRVSRVDDPHGLGLGVLPEDTLRALGAQTRHLGLVLLRQVRNIAKRRVGKLGELLGHLGELGESPFHQRLLDRLGVKRGHDQESLGVGGADEHEGVGVELESLLGGLGIAGGNQAVRRVLVELLLVEIVGARVEDETGPQLAGLEGVRAETTDVLETGVLVGDLLDGLILDVL
ncbi:hypothetical protein CTA1_6712 [Colletotrichum tanaceti]|uniref:Uncharacterized protein n=1 Tax=Colletotrichum tanaceti TaxID=1306861 RepID=A0A4U6XPW8_9PEZI|nr:hypothetical protein CTA1_6712 [Colletotrichum tanaceti]